MTVVLRDDQSVMTDGDAEYKEEEYIDYEAEALKQLHEQDYLPDPVCPAVSRAKHWLRYYPVGFE